MAGEQVTNVTHPGRSVSFDQNRYAALELVTLTALPGALAAVARLNVFEVLAAAGPEAELTAAEIADLAMPGKAINVSYLTRLLRMMSGKKILREVVVTSTAERRYALEPMARFLVDDPEKGSFVNLLLANQNQGFLRCWEHLHESVLDDSMQPFARAHDGLNAWEYGKQVPEFDRIFNKAMGGLSKVYMAAILDAYHGFADTKVLVDVGGGSASALSMITARYPHIQGINFDQPHVIAACPELPRVVHVAGNMFKSVPPGGDAILIKFILHDWDDESCLKILKNCYQALPLHGKAIAIDNMLPEIIDINSPDTMALQVDVHMLAYNDSGARERTESECRKLGLAAGFKQVKVACKVDAIVVIEFHKL